MAQLPIYDNSAGFSDGSGSLRLKSDNAFEELGNSISRFGASAGEAYMQGQRADLIIQKVQEEEAKRAAGIDDAITRNDLVNTWQAKQQKLIDNMPPSGAGYSDAVARDFDEHVASYQGKFSSTRERENVALLMQMRTQVVGNAIATEAKVRRDTTAKLAESDFASAAALATEAGPGAVARIMSEGELKADAYNFPPNMRAEYLKNYRKNMEIGLAANAQKTKPYEIIEAGDGLFNNMPAAGANAEVKKLVNAANAVGADPSILVAIGHIETGGKFDPELAPIGKDGKPMSSAKGVLQLLDGYRNGAGKSKDTELQGRAVGLELGDIKERLEAKGLKATPGSYFMFHNLGDGVAMNLLRAAPDEKMEDIVRRTYLSDPAQAEKVLANNPRMYNGKMTAAQVRQRYETEMAGAINATSKYLSGDVGTSDEMARDRLTSLLGTNVEHLGTADLKRMVDTAKEDLSKVNKRDNDLLVGHAIHTGQVRIDPFDPEAGKKLNKFAETTGISEGILQGKPEAFSAARETTRITNVIPQPYENAYRELIVSGDASDPKKAMAYEQLAGIMQGNPVAWAASKLPKDVKDRVELYVTRTKGMDSILSPAEAIRGITAQYTTDGDSMKDAARKLWKSNHEAEIKALSFSDVEKTVSKGLFWNAKLFDQNGKSADVRQQAVFTQYVDAYKNYREQGFVPDDAKAKALTDVGKSFGVSSVLRGFTENAELTRFPIEQRYPAIDAKNPHKWIEEQAWNLTKIALIKKGFTGLANSDEIDPNVPLSRPEMRLVPTQRTMDEWNAGKLPSYDLMYRNPKSGKFELAMEAWYPNYADAQEVYDAKFLKDAGGRRAVNAIKQSPEMGLVSGRTNPKLM